MTKQTIEVIGGRIIDCRRGYELVVRGKVVNTFYNYEQAAVALSATPGATLRYWVKKLG